MRLCWLLPTCALLGCLGTAGGKATDLFPDAIDEAAVKWIKLGEGWRGECLDRLREMRVAVVSRERVQKECSNRRAVACVSDAENFWTTAGIRDSVPQAWVTEGKDESALVIHEGGHVLSRCHLGHPDGGHCGPYFADEDCRPPVRVTGGQ